MKKSPLVPVLSGVLAASVAGSAAAFVFVDPLNNALENTFTSPEKQIVKVNTSYFGSVIDDVFTAVDSVSEASSDVKEGFKTTLTVIPGEEMLAESESTSIKSVGFSASAMVDNKISAQDISVLINDENVITAKTYIDANIPAAYFSIPELSDDLIMVSVDDLDEVIDDMTAINELTTTLTESTESLTTSLEELGITKEVFDRINERYINLVFESIDDVSRATNVEGDVNGAEFKYTTLTVELTYQDLYDISIDVLEEVKDDDDIKDIIMKAYDEVATIATTEGSEMEMTAEEMYAEFVSGIDEMLEGMEEPEDNDEFDMDDEFAKVVEWLDKDNNLVGFELSSLVKDEEFSMGMLMVDNDKEYAIEEWVFDGYTVAMQIDGYLEKEDKAVTGYINMSVDGEEMKFNFDKFLVDEEADVISGSFDATMVTGYDEYQEKMGIKFTADTTNSVKTTSMTMLENDKEMLTFKLVNETIPFTSIVIPEYKYTIDQMEEYLENCDTEAYLDDMKNKLGEDVYNEIMGDMDIDLPVSIPDIEGMTEDEAFDALVDAGINDYDISVYYEDTDDSSLDGIVSTYSSYVDDWDDTCVELYVYSYEAPVLDLESIEQIPYLKMDEQEAYDYITDLGVDGENIYVAYMPTISEAEVDTVIYTEVDYDYDDNPIVCIFIGVLNEELGFVENAVNMPYDSAVSMLTSRGIDAENIFAEYEKVYDEADDSKVLDTLVYMDEQGNVYVGLYVGEYTSTISVEDGRVNVDDIVFEVNGHTTKFPFKTTYLNSYVWEDEDVSTIGPESYIWGYSADGEISFTAANEFEHGEDIYPDESYIDYIDIGEGASDSISINGIKIGSTIADLNAVFGTDYDEYEYYIEFNTHDADLSFEFSFDEGICTGIFAECYNYSITDDGDVTFYTFAG